MPPRSTIHRPVSILLAAALLAAVGPAAAQGTAASIPLPVPVAASAPAVSDPGGPRWTELSASQRKVLAPLAGDWNDGIDSRSKERWLVVAGRFHRMPAEEQQRATQRMVEWAHMTVAQRVQARENFQELRSVSREEREARWKAYQALPEEQKRELARRAAAAAARASGASAIAGVHRHQATPLTAIQPKTNVVAPATAAAGHAPAGSAPLVAAQARPGATTAPINRHATPPSHLRDGQPKIAAGPNSVDRTTLLPKRVPPVASAAAPAASSAHP